MRTVEIVAEMQDCVREWRRRGQTIGLVPTMGYLHEGHRSLIKRAQSECDVVVVSVFVNPTQFGEGEDLDSYPRDLDADRKACREEGVTVMFVPGVSEMYREDHSVFVDETVLSTGLCGAHRPGHFRGVTTVVAKLFNIVQPDVAVFGQKDAQQAYVIKRMVRDLSYAVRIIVAPIVREPDGLALSSRNSYLSPDERERATCLYRSLMAVRELYEKGERDAGALREHMRARLHATGGVDVEYIALVASETLEPVETVEGEALIALAVRIGTTRLIDNTILS